MSLLFYLWLHLAGVGLVLIALGGLARLPDHSGKGLEIAHGVGMLIAFVSGFGLIAKSGIEWPWPGWIYGKLLIWLVLGASSTVLKKLPQLSPMLRWVLWVVFILAAWLATYKPF
ncbi:MAG: hypothetical protein VX733_02750 [Candidatus Latescibacterota bacterium]|nr:hypothetical protein [Candidatus Latescibacterota bacterium]